MAFSYIDKSNIADAFNESKDYMRPVFEPLNEYERLVRNKPKDNLPDGLPPTTDGTTAAYAQARPKSIIQQLPNGIITSLDKDKDLAGVADLVLTQEIIPNANDTGTVLQKSWAAVSKALTYGSQPAFVFFTRNGDYTGASFKLPYIKDVFFEKGKIYDKDNNVMFMRAWYQQLDIKTIIHQAEKTIKSGLASPWKPELLKDLQAKPKDDDAKTADEREKNLDVGGIEIIFAMQKGVGGMFYGYSPELDEVVYESVNPDPRGVIPIHYLYADLDMSNPIGRGSVELTAGLQNMLDTEMQFYQYGQVLGLAPPVIKRGNYSSSQLRFKPNAIWDLGQDPNAQAQLVNISSTAMTNFSQNYGLIKSQMLNINNENDTSVSSTAGNPSFSKTDSGVKAQQERVSITDNQLTKQYESWIGDVYETMLNLHFALKTGDREVELTQEYINHRKIAEPEFEAKEAIVHYDEVRSGFKFDVNFSSSKVKNDAEAVENLQKILELKKQYPELEQYINVEKVFTRLVSKIGVEDPEELIIKPEQLEEGQEEGLLSDQEQGEQDSTPELEGALMQILGGGQ